MPNPSSRSFAHPYGSPIHGYLAARTSLLNRSSAKHGRDALVAAAARMRHLPLPGSPEHARQLVPRGPETMTRYGCILERSFKIDYTEVGGLGQPECCWSARW